MYEDFQCPICHDFEGEAGDRLRKAVDAGRIRLDYRMVAFLDDASTTDYSTRALNAAAVVLDTVRPGRLPRSSTTCSSTTSRPRAARGCPTPSWWRYAVRAGADESAVRPGIEGLTFRQWAVNATSQMSRDGVNGTPTVLVDGEMQPEATLQSSIDTALRAIG